MIRLVVIGGFLLVSVAIIVAAFQVGADSPTGTLLINLGTEIFGILITVAVVEWFLDRRRRQDRARELSWGVLHSLERAVWVWQGGPRQMGTDELLGVISGIQTDHPMEPGTRALLVALGTQSKETLDKEGAAIRTLPGLRPALEDLTSLRTLSDGGGSIRMVGEILEAATLGVSGVLGLSTLKIPGALVAHRDSSSTAQRERLLEERPGVVIPGGPGERGSGPSEARAR
jgi:hypothetical protein